MPPTDAELKVLLKSQQAGGLSALLDADDPERLIAIVRDLLRCRKELRIAKRFLNHQGLEIRLGFSAAMREASKPKRRKRGPLPRVAMLPIFDEETP